MRSPITRHSIWQVAVDAALVAARLVACVESALREPARSTTTGTSTGASSSSSSGSSFRSSRLSGFYNRWWRYVSTRDMWAAFRGVVLASVAVFLVFTLFDVHRVAVPRGVWFIDLLLCLALVAGSRLLARTLIERPLPGRIVARGKDVVVVGAGDAAQLVVKEMQRNPALGYTPIGLLDDDPRKRNLRLHGVRVLGTIADLAHIVRDRRPDEILIAIPTASGELRAQHRRDRAATARPGEDAAEPLRPRLGRPRPRAPAPAGRGGGRARPRAGGASTSRRSRGIVADEVVLVTGAGGSIGSELCRQIARLRPAKLVLLDNAEPALFDIERELVRDRGFLAAAAVVGDVKDAGQAPAGLRQVPARRRLPRRGVQARRADGGEPRSRPCGTTRSARASSPTSPPSTARSGSCSSRPTRRRTRRP